MIITITEFSAQRGEDRDTVNAFIRKHPEIAKDVSKKGKHTVIDTVSDGFALLDKQYPLPKPIEIIEDKESREKLIKAQEYIIQLQDKLSQAQLKVAQADAMKILLEDKELQLEKADELIKKVDVENQTFKIEIKDQALEIERLRSENNRISMEYEKLRNRGLLARLLNR